MILRQTKAFLRDSDKLTMNDKHFTRFVEYLYLLSQGRPLPPETRDHALTTSSGNEGNDNNITIKIYCSGIFTASLCQARAWHSA